MIVELGGGSATPCVRWIRSTSFKHSQKMAAEAGPSCLLDGLLRAAVERLTSLHIVASSAVIVKQIKHQPIPKSTRHARLYQSYEAATRSVRVLSWSHQPGGFNMMATRAANIAMDSHRTSQHPVYFPRDELREVEQHLGTDLGHWAQTRHDSTDRTWLEAMPATRGILPASHDLGRAQKRPRSHGYL